MKIKVPEQIYTTTCEAFKQSAELACGNVPYIEKIPEGEPPTDYVFLKAVDKLQDPDNNPLLPPRSVTRYGNYGLRVILAAEAGTSANEYAVQCIEQNTQLARKIYVGTAIAGLALSGYSAVMQTASIESAIGNTTAIVFGLRAVMQSSKLSFIRSILSKRRKP